MATVIISIVFFLLLLGLLTAGAVLCLHLWARKLGIQSRILLAALLGPGSVLVFPLLIVLLDGSAPLADLGLGLGVGGAFFCVVIGWPVSAILTRKLEKSMLPDPGIFE